eukprot:g629.t1
METEASTMLARLVAALVHVPDADATSTKTADADAADAAAAAANRASAQAFAASLSAERAFVDVVLTELLRIAGDIVEASALSSQRQPRAEVAANGGPMAKGQRRGSRRFGGRRASKAQKAAAAKAAGTSNTLAAATRAATARRADAEARALALHGAAAAWMEALWHLTHALAPSADDSGAVGAAAARGGTAAAHHVAPDPQAALGTARGQRVLMLLVSTGNADAPPLPGGALSPLARKLRDARRHTRLLALRLLRLALLHSSVAPRIFVTARAEHAKRAVFWLAAAPVSGGGGATVAALAGVLAAAAKDNGGRALATGGGDDDDVQCRTVLVEEMFCVQVAVDKLLALLDLAAARAGTGAGPGTGAGASTDAEAGIETTTARWAAVAQLLLLLLRLVRRRQRTAAGGAADAAAGVAAGSRQAAVDGANGTHNSHATLHGAALAIAALPVGRGAGKGSNGTSQEEALADAQEQQRDACVHGCASALAHIVEHTDRETGADTDADNAERKGEHESSAHGTSESESETESDSDSDSGSDGGYPMATHALGSAANSAATRGAVYSFRTRGEDEVGARAERCILPFPAVPTPLLAPPLSLATSLPSRGASTPIDSTELGTGDRVHKHGSSDDSGSSGDDDHVPVSFGGVAEAVGGAGWLARHAGRNMYVRGGCGGDSGGSDSGCGALAGGALVAVDGDAAVVGICELLCRAGRAFIDERTRTRMRDSVGGGKHSVDGRAPGAFSQPTSTVGDAAAAAAAAVSADVEASQALAAIKSVGRGHGAGAAALTGAYLSQCQRDAQRMAARDARRVLAAASCGAALSVLEDAMSRCCFRVGDGDSSGGDRRHGGGRISKALLWAERAYRALLRDECVGAGGAVGAGAGAATDVDQGALATAATAAATLIATRPPTTTATTKK